MTTRDGKVGFGIIGLNYGLNRCPLIQRSPDARLVAVAARSADKAKDAGSKLGVDWYTDYRELLKRDDVDVVGVYTPSGQHRDIAIDAARAGKHVLLTKPMEITLERCDAIISACEKAKVKLATEFIFRYRPSNYALYRSIADGKFGQMVLGEFAYKCFRSQAYYESNGGWRGTWAIDGGGAIMNQTIHTVDQMLWMMGEPLTVVAHCGTYTHRIEAEDTGVAVFTFKSGAFGILVGTTTFLNDRPMGAYGSDTRRIEVNGGRSSATIQEDKVIMWKMEGAEAPACDARPPAANVFEDFVRWVKEDNYDSPTLVKADQSRKTVEVVLAIYESARTGKSVTLPLR
jgi:predicted dehydrogenase